MHVATKLHWNAGRGQWAEILRHDGGATPEESERVLSHAGVSDRDKLTVSGFRLTIENANGIQSIALDLELTQRAARSFLTDSLAQSQSFLDGRAIAEEGVERFADHERIMPHS